MPRFHQPTHRRIPLAAALAAALLLAGCDEGDGPPAAGDTPRGDSAAAGDSAPGDSRAGDPAAGDPGASGDSHIVANSCAEISASECFANHECQPAERCQSVSPNPGDAVCCVPGARGTAVAGTACDPATGELFCASGICIDSGSVALCSKTCTSIADCPAGMKRCMAIAFSGSADDWCFPE